MRHAFFLLCLTILVVLVGAGPARAEYTVTFSGYTASGPIDFDHGPDHACNYLAAKLPATGHDWRSIFPQTLYFPGSVYGASVSWAANLYTSGSVVTETTTNSVGQPDGGNHVGPGCVLRSMLGADGAFVRIWVPGVEACDSTTQDMVNGACVPKCTATQVRNASGTCVPACQEPYYGGFTFLAGQQRIARECRFPGGVSIPSEGLGGVSGPGCWHYVGSKTGSGVNSDGTYFEEYSNYTQPSDVCSAAGTKECPSGSSCPVVNDPNNSSNTSGGSTSTGGTSTGGTTASGGSGSGGAQVAAVQYCSNESFNASVRGNYCNADGSGKAFYPASSGNKGSYSPCIVPASDGVGSQGNGYDAKYCYHNNYSVSEHQAICVADSQNYPLYNGPSPAAYSVNDASPSAACLAASHPQAQAYAQSYQGDAVNSSPPYDLNLAYHCQYVKTAVGYSDGGSTLYRYKPLGEPCLGGSATTGGTSTGGTSTGGTSTGGTSTGGTSTGGTSTGGTSTGGTSTGGTSTGGTSTSGGSTGGNSTETVTSDEPVTSPGTPSVPSSFYTSKYPNGINGAVQTRLAEVKNTGIVKWLQDFGLTDGGSWEPKWTFALGKFGTHVIEIPAWIMSALRAIVLISAILTARKIVFGG